MMTMMNAVQFPTLSQCVDEIHLRSTLPIFLRANNYQKTNLAMVMWHCEVIDATMFV